MEGDPKILEQLKLTDKEAMILEEISRQTEEETGMDRAAAVAQMRFDYIEDVCSEGVVKPRESRERTRSRRIDQFLTGKYTGIPAFIGIMGLVFWLTFNVIGAFFQGILESGITALTDAVDQAMQAAQVTAGILPGAALDKTQAAALQQAQRGLYYEADGITLRDGLWDEDAAAAWRSAVMAALGAESAEADDN